MAKIIDAAGLEQQVTLDVSIYREAADAGLTVPQLINSKYEVKNPEVNGTAFEQICASEGLFVHTDRNHNIRAPKLGDVLKGEKATVNAGVIVREASPASRIVFPAVILEAMEDGLVAQTDDYVGGFNSLIAVDTSINGARFEQPVLNYSKPEAARSQIISQLALPASMLGITVSDTAKKIPTMSLGMEISDEALKAESVTLDLVTLALQRQAMVERAARVDEYIAALISGDADMGSSALTPLSSETLDSACTTGVLTHKAWIKYLRNNYRLRHIDWVFCSLNTALQIENRVGKPTIATDDPKSPRIDALMQISNVQWQNVKMFLVEDGVIADGTVLGIDSRYAIRRVRNTAADYAATENFVLRKATALRFDHAEVVYRLFDEAFQVLTID